VVELRGKVGASGSLDTTSLGAKAEGGQPVAETKLQDAILALTALGYKTADADTAIRRAALAVGPKATTEQLIKKALN
jgi:Holliday junction DNA helicase RuvA